MVIGIRELALSDNKKSWYQLGAYTDRLGIGSVRLVCRVEVLTYKAMNSYNWSLFCYFEKF